MKKTLTILTASLLIMANSVFAQEQSANTFTLEVGKFEVILLSERQGEGNSSILIGETQQMRDRCIPSGTFPNATNAFLIKTPEQNVLVDAGVHHAKLAENLHSLGISTDQINAVLITHMHGDHFGGLLENGRVAFPKAKLYVSRPEYDFWMNDSIMSQVPENRRVGFYAVRTVFEAYGDNTRLFEPNELGGKELFSMLPDIAPIAAYGHTPGHTMYFIESDYERILIWGDLTHAMAIQMPYPSVAVTFDVNPKQAVETREKVLEFVSRYHIPVAGMHIPFPGMGMISTLSIGGYVFYPFNE